MCGPDILIKKDFREIIVNYKDLFITFMELWKAYDRGEQFLYTYGTRIATGSKKTEKE